MRPCYPLRCWRTAEIPPDTARRATGPPTIRASQPVLRVGRTGPPVRGARSWTGSGPGFQSSPAVQPLSSICNRYEPLVLIRMTPTYYCPVGTPHQHFWRCGSVFFHAWSSHRGHPPRLATSFFRQRATWPRIPENLSSSKKATSSRATSKPSAGRFPIRASSN